MGNVGESSSADSFHRLLTPSTAAAVHLPRRGRSQRLRRSRPAALPSIAYRGFAVAPKPLRALARNLVYNPWVQGRNPARFKGGYGVPRGFKGEKSKSPPNPLGLAERVPCPVGGGRRSSPSLLCRTSFYFPTHARHTRHKKHMKHTRNRS